MAFNERAAAEMRERTTDLPGLHVRTLNALGLALLDGRGAFTRRAAAATRCSTSGPCAPSSSGLVETPRRMNTDPLAPWIDALAEVRLSLRDPKAVEAAYDGEVDGLPDVLERYRAILRDRHAVDFDEQIAHAIEVLLAEPATRAAAQRACRVLLVDEFQDLAPAHLLLVRLLAAPDLAVFGVGDDDQTIYGFSGATPEWLIRYTDLFPGAGDHPLEVNYRCPVAVVDATRLLLQGNQRRVAKKIRPGPAAHAGSHGLRIVTADETVAATADAVAAAIDAGAAPSDVVVLTRVNATLAAVQVVLRHRGIRVEKAVDERWLERTGVRSAHGVGAPGDIARAAVGAATFARRPGDRRGAGRPRWWAG